MRVRIHPAPPYEHTGSMIVADATSGPPGSVPRRPSAPSPKSRTSAAAAAADARRFAIHASRMIFEVMDRRRGAGQLSGIVSPPVAEHLAVLVRHNVLRSGDPTAAAAVRRVHVQLRDPSTAEVFGTYAVGGRVRAFAGRAQRVPCRLPSVRAPRSHGLSKAEYRWQMVEFALS
ncbi:Rv3235 family protein [Gordonia bronchialis]|uniref:Rv3235 family protein n=1 Tax=Gordonia bronchialis TaxID=2054 RepID=UPI0024330F62|nr:Rv3235 family protein [Gordonia bronchialis]